MLFSALFVLALVFVFLFSFNWFFYSLDPKRWNHIHPMHFVGTYLCHGQSISHVHCYLPPVRLYIFLCGLLLCYCYLFTLVCAGNKGKELRRDSNHFEGQINAPSSLLNSSSIWNESHAKLTHQPYIQSLSFRVSNRGYIIIKKKKKKMETFSNAKHVLSMLLGITL